jgi:YtxH-like protein
MPGVVSLLCDRLEWWHGQQTLSSNANSLEAGKMNQFLRLLFGVGLALTDTKQRHRIYDRVSDRLDDMADHASRSYENATDRVQRAYRSVRGEDHPVLAGTASFLVGVGVGVGAGLLFAPASGKQTRKAIVEKVERFQSDVRGSARKTA